MASQITYVALVCLLAATLVAGQTSSTPDELNLSNNDKTNNRQESLDQQKPQDQQPNDVPSQTELSSPAPKPQESGTSSGDTITVDEQENFTRPPFSRPFISPFFNLLNGPGSLFDTIRQQTQMMDRQFDQLRQQAAEGQDVRYFSRNGVSYVRTCTTKRV